MTDLGFRTRRGAAARLGAGALGLGLAAAVLAGCASTPTAVPTPEATIEVVPTTPEKAPAARATVPVELADGTVVREDEWSAADAVDIELRGTTAASGSSGVRVAGATVTIAAAGVYRLSGTLDGQVVVDAPDDALVVLILDGVAIDSAETAAIAVVSADDVAVHLAAGSRNSLADAAAYPADAEIHAALFSEEDLTISGTGALEVTGRGGDGIVAEDDLAIIGGELVVTAADDGLRGKDSLLVEAGALTVTAADDGLIADNAEDEGRGWLSIEGGTVTVASGDDAIKGELAVLVSGGVIDITAAVEGIEAAYIAIAGGTIGIVSSDDGMNAASDVIATPDVTITGGDITIDAEGDGFDSNGTAAMSGGTLTIHGPTRQDNGAIDADRGVAVTGGTLIALGSAGMAQTPAADSTQGWISARADYAAGASIEVIDAAGQTVATVVARKPGGSVIVSTPDIATGETYEVRIDGASGASVVAGEGAAGGMPGPGGGGGQPFPQDGFGPTRG